MAIDFRIASHGFLPDTSIVEILIDGEVAGVVYPAGEKGIKIVSAHMTEVIPEGGFAGEILENDGSTSWPPIPAILIRFSPSPYVIQGNKVVILSPREE